MLIKVGFEEDLQMPFEVVDFGTMNRDMELLSVTNVLGYVVEGSCVIEGKNETLHVSAGDSYLLREDEPYRCYGNSDESWVCIWIGMSGKIVEPVLDAYGLTHSTCFQGISIQDYIRQIHNIATVFPDKELAMEQCCDAFIKVCQYIRRQRTTHTKKYDSMQDVAVLKSYIDTHLSEQFTSEKCSQILSLSVSQTIRKFRGAYGVPPCEYVNRRRIEIAKRLLEDSTQSVQEIAEHIGFHDPYYFSKYFKKRCGKSPNEYRREIHKK